MWKCVKVIECSHKIIGCTVNGRFFILESWYMLLVDYLPSTKVTALQVLTYLILIATLFGMYFYPFYRGKNWGIE